MRECSFLGMCLAVEKTLTPDPQCSTTYSLVGKWSDLDRAEHSRRGNLHQNFGAKLCTEPEFANGVSAHISWDKGKTYNTSLAQFLQFS